MIWFDFWHDLACLHRIGLPHWQVLLPCRKDQTSLFERQATGDTTDSPASRCLRTSRGFLTSWVFLFRADAEKASDAVNTVGFSTRWETAKRNKTDMPALFDRKHASMPAYTDLFFVIMMSAVASTAMKQEGTFFFEVSSQHSGMLPALLNN